jgi:uridine kinase
MRQYQTTVKPMHNEWVEPSKARADVIVNSETGHSVNVAISILSSHLRLHGGLLEGSDPPPPTSDNNDK